jgi:hypothetical protein
MLAGGRCQAKRLLRTKKTGPTHRFDALNVKSTGCHICSHKDVNLFILKAPKKSHRDAYLDTLPQHAPWEPEPESHQSLRESSNLV